MYDLTFISNNGETLRMNYENNIIISTVDGATGINVNLGTAQGYQQIGESIVSQSILGRDISISGHILNGDTRTKQKLLRVFSPFVSGRLVWENRYFIDVTVQDTPTISQERHSDFIFRLKSGSPFWSSVTQVISENGKTTAEFRFPVNYATPHRFGTKDGGLNFSLFNEGMVDSPLTVNIEGGADIVNPSITNVITGDILRFNGTLFTGEKLTLYTENGKIRVLKTDVAGVTEDAFGMLDDDSTLFNVKTGDNVFSATADEGALNMTVLLSFYPLYSGVLMFGV